MDVVNRAEYQRMYYARNREEIRIKHKIWREQNPSYFQTYYLTNREKKLAQAKIRQFTLTDEQLMEKYERYRDIKSVEERIRSRKRSLEQHYGLTLEQFTNMLAQQGGVCACCGSNDSGGHSWHVDHDHTTGVIRAIVCRFCNHTIGFAKEDIDRLRACIMYLERHELAYAMADYEHTRKKEENGCS